MGEEEKKAIEIIKSYIVEVVGMPKNNLFSEGGTQTYNEAVEKVLNLIEKQEQTSHYIQSQLDIANAKIIEQAKEIEERRKQLETGKHNFGELIKELGKIEEERDMYRQQVNSAFDRGFIHKDKIKIQIEQLESMNVEGEAFTTAVKFGTKILKELLED